MAGFNRQATLRAAEKALREGQLSVAIKEYARVIESDPGDWNTASALGDLYIRDHEHALLQSGEMAARIGLLADARNASAEVAARRSRRGDEQGAALMQGRIEALDADEPKVTRSV